MAKSKTTPTRAEAGFSLVELTMALIVLAFGVVGLATTTLFITRQLTLAEVTTARAAAIQTVREGIRAMPYDSIDNGGGGTIGPLQVTWTATTTSAQTKVIRLVSVGPGMVPLSESGVSPILSNEVADTVVYRVLRP